MKFSKRQDIAAPIATVFAAVSDFPALERMARRRGIEVSRQGDPAAKAAGVSWKIVAPVRGRPRDISLIVTRLEAPSDLHLAGKSGGIDSEVSVELVELSRSMTRLQFGIELTPTTLTARLLLQSAKLAKGSLDRRFAKRVEDFCAEIETRHKKSAGMA